MFLFASIHSSYILTLRMDKRIVITVFIILGAIGFIWFSLLEEQNLLQNQDEEPQEVAGEITSLYVALPNLVIETADLSAVSVYATPADRQEEDFLWGEAQLVEQFGQRQTWTFAVPAPQLLRKVYVIGEDANGLTTERTVFPIAGISDIYEALWDTTPNVIDTLAVGDVLVGDEYSLRLEQILEDSRCPADVRCIQAGRLVVEILVSENGEEERFVISSAEEEVNMGDRYIKIIQIDPHPSEEEIADNEYAVTFSIIDDPLIGNTNE